MNAFQILGVGFSLLVVLLVAAALLRRRVARGPGVFWLLVWCAAAGAIAFPQATALAAAALGISRGADLVFYCAILAMMAGFFLVYARLRRLEASVTELTRYLAIRDAREPSQPAGGTEGGE